ncbi:MAG: ParB/RepB/Spo0J family partition protein [Lachnospiraceae bacterium]|nr:ParB/RepB/Spo0J family partition protein [Lachnospiraceae bacterium]
MAVKKRGLGKGLDSLIPAVEKPAEKAPEKKAPAKKAASGSKEKTSASTKEKAAAVKEKTPAVKDKAPAAKEKAPKAQPAAESTGAPVMLKIGSVEPNAQQPRKNFDDGSLTELTESIKQYGVIQPLLVTKQGRGYRIIAGERRWRAARNAGLKEIPAIIRDYSPQEVIEVALIENIQREDLNPIEEAYAYQKLIDDFGLKQEDAARKVSKSRAAVANSLRLIKLCDRAKELVISGQLSGGHARALLAITDPVMQAAAAEEIANKGLSVRETEKLVKTFGKAVPRKKTASGDNERAAYKEVEKRLRGIMDTKVSVVKTNSKKGRIEIEFYSPEDLERIIDLFESITGD